MNGARCSSPDPGVYEASSSSRTTGERKGGNADDAARPSPVDLRRLHLADAVIAHVRLREPPEHSRLEVRRVEDEAWPVGEILQGRAVEQVLPVRGGDLLADRHAGRDQAERNRGNVDRLPRQRAERLDELGLEALGDAAVVEGELRPGEPEHTGRDRAAGNAGHALEPRQVASLVEPPESADMEEHRAVAAARETERGTGLLPPLAISRLRRRGQLGHPHPLPAILTRFRRRVECGVGEGGLFEQRLESLRRWAPGSRALDPRAPRRLTGDAARGARRAQRLPLEPDSWFDVREYVMWALEDPSAPEHLDVIELATRVPIRSVRQRLVGIAESGEPEERRRAALALGRAGESQAAGPLLALLDDEPEAAEVLTLIDTLAVVDELEQRWKSGGGFWLAVTLARNGRDEPIAAELEASPRIRTSPTSGPTPRRACASRRCSAESVPCRMRFAELSIESGTDGSRGTSSRTFCSRRPRPRRRQKSGGPPWRTSLKPSESSCNARSETASPNTTPIRPSRS